MTTDERIATALEQIALELGTLRDDLGSLLAGRLQAPFPPYQGTPAPWVCPIHHSFKTVPQGGTAGVTQHVSTRTNKTYTAFVACDQQGCNEKPPRGYNPAPARAIPPSQGVQGAQLP